MLFLAIVLFELPFLYVNSINLTYILRREKTHLQPSCIAEELERYAAVGWVYPMPSVGAGIPNTTTKYIPTIESDYNCKFHKNDKCNIKWTNKDWQIDESSSKTREFIDDSRWEDLTTVLVSNFSKEFEYRFHIETAHKNGFSVRASGAVELLICSGWNPHNYPCYYFHIDQREIFFHKYDVLPADVDYKKDHLENYKAFSNILSNDEWRNFEVSVNEDGNVTLIDKNLNRTVIEYNDPEPLKPMYFLMRSKEPSLWKVVENQFMFTKTAQISRMGPQIQTTYKDLCISLFVATCNDCEMHFFYMNGTNRKSLKQVGSTDDKWIEIKLKQENILLGRFNIFVETKFVDETVGQTEGWWAYDDVRVCNENEVKVSYLKLNETFAEDDVSVEIISCQLIKKPSFRPNILEYDQIEDFPPVKVTSNDTSIVVSWPQEDLDNYINYFIFYQGNDICSSELASSKRLKSGGFLSTKHNEITISNLVPYTVYNITMSSVLHEKDKYIRVNTLETDEPTLEELPFKIHIRPLNTAVNISWEQPPCNAKSGRLIYTLIVSNPKFNFNKSLELQTDNQYLINGLRPYTSHTLTVLTARNARNLMKGLHTHTLSYNFTTLAGVAPAVKNLELYAIGPNAAYLRYDLPSHPQGIPTEVQVIRCNKLSFAKCKAVISRIERCTLWNKKLCVNLEYLMPDQNYSFKVSIKNSNTNAFGQESEVEAYTVERVPMPPENITYQVVDCHEKTDYCHLNISWLHPYNPNATINSFNIILNSTYFNTSNSEEDQTMHEVYKIVNDTYLPKYTYQVKYVPYSTEYILYIQSANGKYKSDFTSTIVKTAELGDHIDQSPKLLGKGDKALVFKLPHVDRRLQSYRVTVGIQDFNESVPVYVDTIKNKKLADNLCHPFGVTWISQVLEVEDNHTRTVTITGLDERRAIKPNTKYCIIFIITNNYRGEEHDVVYYEKLRTPDEPEPPADTTKSSSYNHLYILLLLLLLVPIGFLVYRWFKVKNKYFSIMLITLGVRLGGQGEILASSPWLAKGSTKFIRYIGKRRAKKQQKTNENVYESLPFEEHEANFANNRTYDQLIHK